jgi:hypothetical protein
MTYTNIELSFLEAAYLGNTLGYKLPKCIEVSWSDRVHGIAKITGATKALEKLLIDRLVWWGGFLDLKKVFTPESLLFCPWGGFIALVLSQQVGARKVYHISAFTGRKKAPSSYKNNQFITSFGITAEEAAYDLTKLAYYQNEAKPYENPYSVGDVLYSSWGSDQTNISFYQAIKINGLSITVRPIKALTHHNKEIQKDAKGREIEVDTMTSEKAPALNEFDGKEITKKVSASGSIKISSYETANALEYEEKFGVRFYKPKHATGYA